MTLSINQQIAKHLRETYTGGNWTDVTVKDALNGITVEQATAKIEDLNTILALVYHINYYVRGITSVLQGGELNTSDKYAFDHPPIKTEKEWQELVSRTYSEAETLAALIEKFPDERLNETFVTDRYQNYYRNFHGMIEHVHYHLGQIVLIKKLLRNRGATQH